MLNSNILVKRQPMTFRALLMMATALFMISIPAAAQSTAPSGSFGFLFTDFFVDSGDNNGAALLGLMNFDGAGNVSGTYTLQGRGPNDQGTGTFSGTYSSNPDGTGITTLSFDFGLTVTFATVMTDGGHGLQLILTKCAPTSCNIGGGVVSLTGTAQSVNGTLPMSLFVDGASGGVPLTLKSTSDSTTGTIVYTAAPATGSGTVQCPDGSSGTWTASVPSLTAVIGPPGASRHLLALSTRSCGSSDYMLLSGAAYGSVSSNGASLTLLRNGDVFTGIARAAAAGQSLNGSYGYQSGFAPFPRGEVGVLTFDGAGNVTSTVTSVADGSARGSGQPVLTGAGGTGTYSVNPDGTGTVQLQGSGTLAFVITDGGSGILFLRLHTTNENDLQFGTARLQ